MVENLANESEKVASYTYLEIANYIYLLGKI